MSCSVLSFVKFAFQVLSEAEVWTEFGIMTLNATTGISILIALVAHKGHCCLSVSVLVLVLWFLLGQDAVFFLSNYVVDEHVRYQVLVPSILGIAMLAHLLGLVVAAGSTRGDSR